MAEPCLLRCCSWQMKVLSFRMEIGEPRSGTKIRQVPCALGLLSNKAQSQGQDRSGMRRLQVAQTSSVLLVVIHWDAAMGRWCGALVTGCPTDGSLRSLIVALVLGN